ncbi:XRE family transcriptional regulator [Streptococcus fryi]
MSVGARIKARRIELGFNADWLAEKIGVSRSTIFRYEKGDIEKMPTETLEKIATVLNTTPAYFMGWTDDPAIATLPILTIYNQLEQPRQDKVLDFAKIQLKEQELEDESDLYEVQGITYAAAASGLGRGYEADDYDTYTVYTREQPPKHDYAIGVRGDSMLPKYEQGDMLYLVDRGLSSYSGQLCIVVHNGETYFKKVYTEEGGLRLVSLNKKYDDIFIDYPPAEDTYIKIYDVIGSFVPVEI